MRRCCYFHCLQLPTMMKRTTTTTPYWFLLLEGEWSIHLLLRSPLLGHHCRQQQYTRLMDQSIQFNSINTRMINRMDNLYISSVVGVVAVVACNYSSAFRANWNVLFHKTKWKRPQWSRQQSVHAPNSPIKIHHRNSVQSNERLHCTSSNWIEYLPIVDFG